MQNLSRKFSQTIQKLAIVILSQHQLEFSKTVAYITSYEQNHFLPNQTKPTNFLPKPSKMFAIVILSPDQLECLKTVAYINSYDQKQVLPNQTKPTDLTVQTKFVKTSVHNI